MSKKYRLKGMRLDELSLVDRPANAQSKVAIWKRKDDNMATKATNGDKRDMDKMSDAEKRRMRELMDKQGMAEKEAMSQAMREMRKQDSPDTTAGSPGTTTSMMKETTMDIEELTKRLGEAEESIARLTKERDEALEKAANPEAVAKAEEETVEIGGEKIAKSAVPEPVLKALEEQRTALEAMTKRQEREDLAKRADAELPSLGGTAEQKGALLKALDGMDKSDAESLLKGLKAADAAVSKMFVEVGKSAADDASSATSRLNKMASDYAAEKGVDQASAFAEVTKTAEGKKLWAESRSEQ